MKEEITGVVFDLDGTILDSMDVWTQVDIKFFAQRNLPFTKDYQKKIGAMTFQEVAEYTILRYGLKEEPEDLKRIWLNMARDAYANEVKLKAGVKEFLYDLKKRKIKIAVATSSEAELFMPCLKHWDIDSCFDSYLTCMEVGRGKEAPDVYLGAADQIQSRPEHTMVFEDILSGTQSAKNAGFYVTAVLDHSSEHDWQKIIQIADHTIRDFSGITIEDLWK